MSASSYSYVSMLQRFGPLMPPGAAALSLSYVAAVQVVPGYGGGMSSAKAALESDTRVLAYEAGKKYKIRVNGISAGPLGSRAAKAIGFIDMIIAYSHANAPIQKELHAAEVRVDAIKEPDRVGCATGRKCGVLPVFAAGVSHNGSSDLRRQRAERHVSGSGQRDRAEGGEGEGSGLKRCPSLYRTSVVKGCRVWHSASPGSSAAPSGCGHRSAAAPRTPPVRDRIRRQTSRGARNKRRCRSWKTAATANVLSCDPTVKRPDRVQQRLPLEYLPLDVASGGHCRAVDVPQLTQLLRLSVLHDSHGGFRVRRTSGSPTSSHSA